jgi:hypothetical protein
VTHADDVAAALRQIIARPAVATVASLEAWEEAQEIFAAGVDRARTAMLVSPQTKVSYRGEVTNKMATFKAVSPEEFATEAAGGVKYAGLVSDFLDANVDIAEVDGEGTSGSTLNVAIRNYLDGRNLPVAVRSKSTKTGKTRKTKKGEDVDVLDVKVFLIRTDTETGRKYAPKPKEAKADSNGQTEATAEAGSNEAEASGEAGSEAEGDPFEQLEGMGAQAQ